MLWSCSDFTRQNVIPVFEVSTLCIILQLDFNLRVYFSFILNICYFFQVIYRDFKGLTDTSRSN